MSIDNKQKRWSVVGVGRPWLRTKNPHTRAVAWRMSVGLSYAGNAISGPPSTVIAWSEAAMIALIINNDATLEKSNYLHSDRSNFRYDELKTEWTGSMVGEDEWEPRNAQDYVKARGSQKDKGPQSPEDDNHFLTSEVTQDDL